MKLMLPGGYRYCGPGNPINNGQPINKLDAICRQHDLCYENDVNEQECDRLMVHQLKGLSWRNILTFPVAYLLNVDNYKREIETYNYFIRLMKYFRL